MLFSKLNCTIHDPRWQIYIIYIIFIYYFCSQKSPFVQLWIYCDYLKHVCHELNKYINTCKKIFIYPIFIILKDMSVAVASIKRLQAQVLDFVTENNVEISHLKSCITAVRQVHVKICFIFPFEMKMLKCFNYVCYFLYACKIHVVNCVQICVIY